MANELKYAGDTLTDSGLTITAKVYDHNFAQVGSDVSMTEVGTLAAYRGDMPAALGGRYLVRFFAGTTPKSETTLLWDGTSVVDRLEGYKDDFVWISFSGGSTGTVLGVNGTFERPANNLADAVAIANARGVRRIFLADFTFTGDPGLSLANFYIEGADTSQNLLSFSGTGLNIGTLVFKNCTVSGSGLSGVMNANLTAIDSQVDSMQISGIMNSRGSRLSGSLYCGSLNASDTTFNNGTNTFPLAIGSTISAGTSITNSTFEGPGLAYGQVSGANNVIEIQNCSGNIAFFGGLEMIINGNSYGNSEALFRVTTRRHVGNLVALSTTDLEGSADLISNQNLILSTNQSSAFLLTTQENAYPNEKIYIDSDATSSGSVQNYHGTFARPVNNWTDANTLAAQVGGIITVIDSLDTPTNATFTDVNATIEGGSTGNPIIPIDNGTYDVGSSRVSRVRFLPSPGDDITLTLGANSVWDTVSFGSFITEIRLNTVGPSYFKECDFGAPGLDLTIGGGITWFEKCVFGDEVVVTGGLAIFSDPVYNVPVSAQGGAAYVANPNGNVFVASDSTGSITVAGGSGPILIGNGAAGSLLLYGRSLDEVIRLGTDTVSVTVATTPPDLSVILDKLNQVNANTQKLTL